jgi:hypothetical protein
VNVTSYKVERFLYWTSKCIAAAGVLTVEVMPSLDQRADKVLVMQSALLWLSASLVVAVPMTLAAVVMRARRLS